MMQIGHGEQLIFFHYLVIEAHLVPLPLEVFGNPMTLGIPQTVMSFCYAKGMAQGILAAKFGTNLCTRLQEDLI